MARLTAFCLACLLAGHASAGPAPRVMSLNVCTDQLVLALADPEQVVSLSELARDPKLSFLHEPASRHQTNRGLAEEVLSARPDVVVTGVYSLHNTTALLRSLGIRVEEFDYAQTIDSIPGDIRRMGAILGQAQRAEQAAVSFERELAELTSGWRGERPRAVVYGQNGVVLASGTLMDSALAAAGFRNAASEAGATGMTPWSLETLIGVRPDVVFVNRPYADAPSLADLSPLHPAIPALGIPVIAGAAPEGSVACGGPFTIEAVRALVRLRGTIAAAGATP